jgi:hypothetical protein
MYRYLGPEERVFIRAAESGDKVEIGRRLDDARIILDRERSIALLEAIGTGKPLSVPSTHKPDERSSNRARHGVEYEPEKTLKVESGYYVITLDQREVMVAERFIRSIIETGELKIEAL